MAKGSDLNQFQTRGVASREHLLASFGGSTGTGTAVAQTVDGGASGAPTLTLGKAYVITRVVTSAAAAPGSSKTYVAKVKIAGTASAQLAATISGASATDSSASGDAIPVTAAQSLGAQFTATGSPSAVVGAILVYGYFVE